MDKIFVQGDESKQAKLKKHGTVCSSINTNASVMKAGAVLPKLKSKSKMQKTFNFNLSLLHVKLDSSKAYFLVPISNQVLMGIRYSIMDKNKI